jgi:hypothetical protein
MTFTARPAYINGDLAGSKGLRREVRFGMKIKRWKRITFAACLTAFTAFACHGAAVSRALAVGAQRPCTNQAVIRGRGLLRAGGYELNVRFTPEGKLVGFDISAVRAKAVSVAGT